ncbi:MAG: FAD-dependent oxidoreductase [Syntrophaceae bacterium]
MPVPPVWPRYLPLRKKGIDVTCLEGNNFVGGGTYSVHKQGDTSELGAQFMFKSYADFFKHYEETDLSHDLVTIPYRIGSPETKHGKIIPVLVTFKSRDRMRKRHMLAIKVQALAGKYTFMPSAERSAQE